MAIEPAILCRQHGIDKMSGQLIERDWLCHALAALGEELPVSAYQLQWDLSGGSQRMLDRITLAQRSFEGEDRPQERAATNQNCIREA